MAQASDSQSGWKLSLWCVAAAFGAYFCTYAFRKPFTGGQFQTAVGDFRELTLLVIAQGLGYTISKFIGIKVIAEMPPGRRVGTLLVLIALAEAALLLFALTPAPYNCIFFFLNGLPLGIVFGLILGFLEGRRHTEALTAGLCASFIVADGACKTVGGYLLQAGVAEAWMPATAGLLFLPALGFFAWMLSRIPAPSQADIAARSVRLPMTRSERWEFFARYAGGLTLLVLVYLLLTILRSVRSDFGRAIWQGLGENGAPELFTLSEASVALCVLPLAGFAIFLRDNRRAFLTALALALAGMALGAAALLGLSAGWLSPLAFMIAHGLGLYLPYVVFHTTLFERLIALTRDRGNIGYLMYLADAVGYLGFAAVMLVQPFVQADDSFLEFFVALSWTIAGACVVLLIPCWWYFAARSASNPAAVINAETATAEA